MTNILVEQESFSTLTWRFWLCSAFRGCSLLLAGGRMGIRTYSESFYASMPDGTIFQRTSWSSPKVPCPRFENWKNECRCCSTCPCFILRVRHFGRDRRRSCRCREGFGAQGVRVANEHADPNLFDPDEPRNAKLRWKGDSCSRLKRTCRRRRQRLKTGRRECWWAYSIPLF